MAQMMKPRAKVRLRLDRGTALLREFGVTSVLCALVDLSENGCQCRISLDDLDDETAEAWRTILAVGRCLTLEMTDPPELRGLVFKEAEVRWVRRVRGGDMEFGLQLGSPEPEQKEILGQALLSFAAGKLRRGAGAAASVAAFTGAGVEAEPLAPLPPGEPTPPPAAADKRAGRTFVTVPRLMQLSGVARQRPRRHKVYLAAVFEFRGADGSEWEHGLHQGRTVDVSESGMLLEGPAPDCCEAKELVERQACARVTIRTSDHDVKGLCTVRSAVPSRHIKDGWLYGLQITEMTEKDRDGLNKIFEQVKGAPKG